MALRTNLFRDTSLVDVAAMIRHWGFWAPVASVGLMTVQAILAPIPAFFISAANGMVFGAWGILVSWIGAMFGAVVAFGIGRTFTSFAMRRIANSGRLRDYIDRFSENYGATVVLVARLLPFVSFDLVSYAAGLSTLRVLPFLAATGVGMLPATVVYTLAGAQAHRVDHYSSWLLIGGIAISAGVVVHSVVTWFLHRRAFGADSEPVDTAGDAP